MRRVAPLLLAMAALALPGAASAAQAVRLVEAFATPKFDPNAVLQVTASTPEQVADPNFNVMASYLGEALEQAKLNIHQDAVAPDVYVLFEYKALAIPFFRRAESSVSDPSYRALVVTAIEAGPWKESKRLEVLWQVAVDQTGISNNADKVLPAMIKAASRYYGRNLTSKGLGIAAACSAEHGAQTGSHIAGACQAETPSALAN